MNGKAGRQGKHARAQTHVFVPGILCLLFVSTIGALALVSSITISDGAAGASSSVRPLDSTTTSTAIASTTTTQPSNLTPNPTCGSAVGYKNDQLAGCVTASPGMLTFNWSGYADYIGSNQGLNFSSNNGVSVDKNIQCSAPSCSYPMSLSPGEYSGYFTIATGNSGPPPEVNFDLMVTSDFVGITPTSDDQGYWLTTNQGKVENFGDATSYGSISSSNLSAPIVGIAPTADNKGYWLDGSDGNVYAFGDAINYGTMLGTKLNQPVVGMASTPDSKGYWLVASDGGIFSFGDATFQGSMGGISLNQPMVGIAADPATSGYWTVAADGGVFSFDATFHGSTGNIKLNKPITEMEAASDGSGYRFELSPNEWCMSR